MTDNKLAAVFKLLDMLAKKLGYGYAVLRPGSKTLGYKYICMFGEHKYPGKSAPLCRDDGSIVSIDMFTSAGMRKLRC